MLTEKNFSAALKVMGFTERGNFFEKTFADGVTMKADLNAKKLFYPTQIQGRERNTDCDESHHENLVVFECVNRLLDKGYRPEDIELERAWHLGHSAKSGRADICVSHEGQTLFIVECKTFGDEFDHELANMNRDGGQLFSYRQQEQSCQWLVLYASAFERGALKISVKSVSCNPNAYREANTVEEFFQIWSERYEKIFFDDVIFNADTVAYKIGVKPLRKRDLKDFSELKSVVNQFEEILRHNPVSNKANAFDVLIALFICKLADESQTAENGEVSFQFKYGTDSHETFQDRLQRLYSEGMEKFLKEKIEYVPLSRVDDLLRQIGKVTREELIAVLKYDYRRMKFFSPNVFAFINVYNEKLFYLNGRVLVEVVRMLQDRYIIGSKDLQTLGDLFEQLLNKGFKQDEGQFFTPIPITHFIWDSLPLDKIIRDNNGEPPKIIDYACGAGHFLTEGYQAVNDCFTRNNLTPPVLWERDKIFGIEKDPRLATVSKISLFMHGAGEGKIKFGEGLEDYPDENILPETFDVLVANPPYSIRGFKTYLQLANEKFSVLEKISNDGSEIETLFVERISQLIKPRGVAAVILPSSILNKDGKSFIAARESLLKNFYVRAIVQLGSKTFGATGTNTVILFLQRIFDPPERAGLLKDSAKIILHDAIQIGDEEEEIFAAYTKKIGISPYDYKKFIAEADEKTIKLEREKIIYFGLTYRQMTLIVTAPADNKEQEIFLGYGWSNAKGREGIVDKKRGGLLFDNENRTAENTIAAVIRAAFRGEQVNLPALKKYFRYATLADLLDFDAVNFTKTINTVPLRNTESKPGMTIYKLGSADFDVSIGNRVLSTEIVDDGEIPVYSANVFEEFGRINKRNLTDFSKPSVIWGIDGDWMVNFIPANVPFYPTDHCGVLRTNTDKIIPEYLAFVLRVEGELENFSRVKRASIQRVKSLRVQIPPLDVQKKIVDDFNALDAQIDSCDETIKSLDADIQKKFTALFADKNFTRLDKIADEIISGTSPASTFYNDSGEGLPFYQGKKDFGELFLKPSTVWTTQAIKTSVKGDILMSVRAPVGDVNMNPFDEICIGRGLAAIRCNESTTREYLFRWLHYHSDEINGHSGATFDSISVNELRAIKIPVPPLELQEEFASYVSTCEAMKKSARERRDKLIHSRGELVTKYFR